MTYYPYPCHRSVETIDVQLHYDHMSGTAYACSPIFRGVLPCLYRTREAAADAARVAIAGTVRDNHPDTSEKGIRIWLR